MSKFEDYKSLKAELVRAEEWAEMIGKMPTRCTYNSPGKISGMGMTVTICYQESDGAKNYHDAPKYLVTAMQENWLKQARSHITDALLLLKARVDAARREAIEEYAALLDADKADNTALVVVPQKWADGGDAMAGALAGM